MTMAKQIGSPSTVLVLDYGEYVDGIAIAID